MCHRFKSSGGFDASGCWILRLRSSYLKQKTSRNIGIISTNVITKIQVVSWYKCLVCAHKHKENILIYNHEVFFPDNHCLLAQVSGLQLFWNNQLHSHFTIISKNDNILDFFYFRFAKTLSPVTHKVEIQNAYKVNGVLRCQPINAL